MNNSFVNALYGKKLQIFFLFYMIMFLPLLSPLAQNLSYKHVSVIIIINSILFISIGILLLFCKSRTQKLVFSGLFIISYLPNTIYTSYLLFAHVLLQKDSVISLFETNPEESKEFLVHYFNPWIIVGCVVYILLCFLIIWKMRVGKPLKIKEHKIAFFSALLSLILVVSLPPLSRSVYFVNFYKLFVNYKIRLNKEECAILERQSQPYEVTDIHQDTVPKNIVVVIGESLTRQHMSLYGYPRNTNPKLAGLGDSLLVYADVISPQVHTIPVLRSVLTLADKDNPDHITEKPSIFELFNRAGYETYFISNQPFGGNFKTSYDVLLNLSKNISNLAPEKQSDEIIFPAFKGILAEDKKKNKLILIHLIGNHMAYEFRYTPSYNVFNNEKDHLIQETKFRDKKAIRTIDKYDNSVLYNDFIISQLISILHKQSDKNTALVYFSDHGEEVYETREFAGHAYEKVSTSMCEVPFLVWMSPEFRMQRQDLVLDTKRSYSTSDFLFSLSDLAGLHYSDYDDKRSIFSMQFEPKERYVGELTYDEVKGRSNKK